MKFAKLVMVPMLALVCGPVMAQKDGPPVFLPIKQLSMDMALRLAQTAIQFCRKEGVNVAVTVVDRGGHPQVVLRDTLAMDLTLTISRDKAYTAMSFNMPTSELEGRFPGAYSVPKVNGLIISAGGLPITIAGSIVGGVGVSGAPSGVTDEKCATAGLNAILDDLEMSGM